MAPMQHARNIVSAPPLRHVHWRHRRLVSMFPTVTALIAWQIRKQTVSLRTSGRYACCIHCVPVSFNQYAHGTNVMNLPPLNSILEALAEGVRRFGPYLLTELLLPGGTVLAVLLFLARRRRARLARAAGRAAHRPRCARDAVGPIPHTARAA